MGEEEWGRMGSGGRGGGLLEKVWTPDIGVYGGAGYDCVAAGHLGEDIFREEEEGMNIRIESGEPLFSVHRLASSDFSKH